MINLKFTINKKHCLPIIILLLILNSLSFAQIRIQTYKLENGLKIILSPIDNIQTVSLFTYFKTGVRDDSINKIGLSTLFKNIRINSATKNFNYLESVFFTKSKGGVLSGKVNFDYSYFYQIIQPEDINIALLMESERFKSMKYNTNMLNLYKQKLISRLKQLIKYNGYYKSFLWINSKIFADTAYSNPLFGTPKTIASIGISDIVEANERYSNPNIATLIIVGKFDTVKIKKIISKYFTNIKKQSRLKHSYSTKKIKITSLSKTSVRKNIPENYVIFGIQAPSVFDKYYMAFKFLKYYLLDKRIGYIKHYLKKINDLNIHIDYKMSDNIEKNSLIIGVSSKKKINIVKARFLIFNFFNRLPNLIINNRINIKQIKYLMEIDYQKKIAGLVSRSEMLAKSEHFYNNLDLSNNILRKIKNINSSKVLAVCKKYFSKNKMVLLYEYNEL